MRGWSMIELLVVIAIISVLAVISIPVVNMFSRNDLRDGARTIYTMLRAARVYAMTHNVETAVVYALDEGFLDSGPIEDTLTGQHVRIIRAAAIMYRLPDEVSFGVGAHLNPQSQLPDEFAGYTPVEPLPAGDPSTGYASDVDKPDVYWRGTYVHAPRIGGSFVFLPEGLAILFNIPPSPQTEDPVFTGDNYADARPPQLYPFDYGLTRSSVESNYEAWYTLHYNRRLEFASEEAALKRLGMVPVHVHYDYVDRQAPPGGGDWYFVTNKHYFGSNVAPLVRPHPAHVFNPRGDLKTRASGEESYRIMVAPDPWQETQDRVAILGDRMRLLHIPIEIHRATGRVKLGS